MIESNTIVDYGMVLQLNERDVVLSPKVVTGALRDAQLNGKEYELPSRVDLGTIANIGELFMNLFGIQVNIVEELKKLPSPLDAIAGKIAQLNLAVEEFYLKIPPTHKMNGKTKVELTDAEKVPLSLTLGLSAFWGAGEKIDLIAGKLAISGVFLKIYRNTGPAALPAPVDA